MFKSFKYRSLFFILAEVYFVLFHVLIVAAEVKSPKADHVACPEMDGYNDHI
jgi:hypothetical protein